MIHIIPIEYKEYESLMDEKLIAEYSTWQEAVSSYEFK